MHELGMGWKIFEIFKKINQKLASITCSNQNTVFVTVSSLSVLKKMTVSEPTYHNYHL